MIKLALRVLLLTIVLEGASLVFAEEAIITLMILFLIALCTAALVMNRERPTTPYQSEPAESRQRPIRSTIPVSSMERSF